MSGGHWGYLSRDLEDDSARLRSAASGHALSPPRRTYLVGEAAVMVLAVVEHELDWGICCDTCYACAVRRLAPAFHALFETWGDDETELMAGPVDAFRRVMQDQSTPSLLCDRDLAREVDLLAAGGNPFRNSPGYAQLVLIEAARRADDLHPEER